MVEHLSSFRESERLLMLSDVERSINVVRAGR